MKMQLPARYSFLLAIVLMFVNETLHAQSSDIIFVDPSGTTAINYINWQNASSLTVGNSASLGTFTIRDGGAGLNDTNATPTTLTSVTFVIYGYQYLRTVAVFDGTTNVSEMTVSGGNTVTFTGLNLVANDGSTKNFTIRGTFKTVVTDKDAITLQLNSATASVSGSGFAAGNAGGAITVNTNFIQVTATMLSMSDYPEWFIYDANFNITVKALDAFLNLDLDVTSAVTLSMPTGNGNFTTNPSPALANVNLVAGQMSWPALRILAAGSKTIRAVSAAGLTQANLNLDVVNSPPEPDPSGTFNATATDYTTAQITFTSFNSSSNRSGYLLLRRADNQPDVSLTDGLGPSQLSLTATTIVTDITTKDLTQYTDSGLTPGTRYTYTLVPYNAVLDFNHTYNYGTSSGLQYVSIRTPARPPVISDFNPKSGPVGTEVTITGSDFGPTAGQTIVYFGAVKAAAPSVFTATTIVVNVPPGATNKPITVTNTAAGVTGSSSYPFQLTFSSDNSLSPAHFMSEKSVALKNAANLSTDPNSIAAEDLNGDGKPDILVSSPSALDLNLVANFHTSGPLTSGSLTRTQLSFSDPSKSFAVGDLDGDGKKDVAIGIRDASNTVRIYKNISTAGPSLTQAMDLSAGDKVNTVVIADVDVDGRPDILAIKDNMFIDFFRNISETPGTINANTFATREQWAGGDLSSDLSHLVVADLDNDGKPEMITALPDIDKIAVYRNTSTPGVATSSIFATPVLFSVGDGPVAIAVGDIDGDQKADIAVANSITRTVSILRNTITGGVYTASSFAAKVDFQTSDYNLANTIAVTIADLSGDGKPELIATNWGDASQAIFRNTATSGAIDASSLAQPFKVAVGPSPFHALVADINLDGRPDIVTGVNYQSVSSYLLSIRENFTPPPVVGGLTPRTGSAGTTIAVDGTGFGATAADNIVYFGAARAEVVNVTSNVLNVKVPIGATYGPVTVSVGHHTAKSSSFFTVSNPGEIPINASAFTSQTKFSTTGRLLAVGDMNNDGKVDVVTVSENYFSVFLNKSVSGTISPQAFGNQSVDFGVPAVCDQLLLEDMNGDGKIDVVLKGTTSGLIYIFKNELTAEGSVFTNTPYAQVTSPTSIRRMAIADVDSDGKPDIVYTASHGTIAVAKNINIKGELATNNGFDDPIEFTPPIAQTGGLLVADFTNDNRPDIVALATSPTNVASLLLYKNIGEAGKLGIESFDSPLTVDIGNLNVSGLHTFDGDADGLPDLIIRSGSTYLVKFNTTSSGAMTFSNHTTFVSGSAAIMDIGMADLNGDFRPDLVLPQTISGGVTIHPNTSIVGTASFLTPVSLQIADIDPSGVALTDIDGDGKTDIIIKGDEGALARFVVLRNGTVDTSAPTVQIFNPVDGATDVSTTTTQLNVTFNEAIKKGTGSVQLHWGSDQVTTISINDVNMSFNTMTVPLTGGLLASQNYYVTIDATAITDLTGNAFAGITDPTTWNFSTPGAPAVADTTPPTVQATAIASVVANTALTVSATVTDAESAISSVSVDYNAINSGPGSPLNKALTLKTGTTNVYEGTIDANQVSRLGIEYKIKATSTGGTTTSAAHQVRVAHSNNGLTIPYTSYGTETSNYRIIAVPLDLENTSIDGVLVDDLGAVDIKKWRIGRYENGSNNQNYTGTIVPGQGYWLIVRTAGATIDTGPGLTVSANLTDQYKLGLTAGWNLIGNPFNFPLSWTDVQSANADLPGISVHNTGAYAPAIRLSEFEGAFINMPAARTITIPVKQTLNSGRINGDAILANPIDQPDWEVGFKLRQGNLITLMPGFGMRKRALNDFDAFDYFTPPRLDEFIEFNHTRKFNGTPYSRDIVPTEPNHVWEFNAETSRESELITIEWDNSYFGNNEQQLVLWDEARQHGIDLRDATSYAFDPRESRRFKVIYGNRNFVTEKTKVASLVFHDVYPNPAQSNATIAFSLSGRSQTDVEVYDMLGNKSVIFSGELPQGYNKVTWNSGDPRAAGMYIIRVISGGEVKLKRLMVK